MRQRPVFARGRVRQRTGKKSTRESSGVYRLFPQLPHCASLVEAAFFGGAMASRRSLSDREIKRLRASFPKLSERNRCYIEVALQTGYRVSELLSLQVGDVWDHETRSVRSQVTVERRHMKGGKGANKRSTCARTVELNDRAQLAIGRFIKHRTKHNDGDPPPPDEPLFLSRCQGKVMTRWAANELVHQAVAQAGVKDLRRIGTHTLRKSFARRVYHELRGDTSGIERLFVHLSETRCWLTLGFGYPFDGLVLFKENA